MTLARFAALVAIALAIAVGAAFLPYAVSLGAAPPMVAATPPPGAAPKERCVSPADARLAFEAALAELGDPPGLLSFAVSGDRLVMVLWILGNPQMMNLVFEDGCLAGQFLTPAP